MIEQYGVVVGNYPGEIKAELAGSGLATKKITEATKLVRYKYLAVAML
jgi:hypothetical protein